MHMFVQCALKHNIVKYEFFLVFVSGCLLSTFVTVQVCLICLDHKSDCILLSASYILLLLTV